MVRPPSIADRRVSLRSCRIDNDQYAHLNNSIYYHLFDSVTNSYLATQCSHKPTSSSEIGLVVHSHCDYFAPAEFPAVLDVCLRVNKLGRSSVTYEIGVFQQGKDEVCAVGEFVHVFVERDGRRPGKMGMAQETKEGLERIKATRGGAKL